MGTLRKLMGRVAAKFNKAREKTVDMIKDIKEEIKEAHADARASSSSHGYGRNNPNRTPGAFGAKPTIAVCKKMYRNRHGKNL